MTHQQWIRKVNDYEVLGVGALRRQQFLKLVNEAELVTHPALVAADQRDLYEAVLHETVAWLKPRQILPALPPRSASEFLEEALLDVLRQEFPQTTAYLKGGLRELLKDYLKQVPWQGPLLSAHFRYWPVFLKRKFQDEHLYLIAQKEWLSSYLSFADFGSPPSEAGRVFVNPSLQSLYTSEEIPEVGLAEGLTVFYYDAPRNSIEEHKMDIWEAALVDLLQEDRKYNVQQLLEQVLMVDLELPLSREEWQIKVNLLKSCGILLEF